MTKTNAQTATKTRAAKSAPAKKPAVNPDAIKSSKAASPKDGDNHIIVSNGGEQRIFPTRLWAGELRKACGVGESFKAAVAAILKAESSKPQLARGITARDAQHSAKAVADRKAGERPAPKAVGKADKVQAKGQAKANAKATRKDVGTGNDRTYKVVNKDHGARPGSKRDLQLQIVFKHTSTAKARAAGAESCDFRFAADKGFIKFA